MRVFVKPQWSISAISSDENSDDEYEVDSEPIRVVLVLNIHTHQEALMLTLMVLLLLH